MKIDKIPLQIFSKIKKYIHTAMNPTKTSYIPTKWKSYLSWFLIMAKSAKK